MKHISSFDNPAFSEAKSLQMKKFRDKEKKFLIEGYKIIYDALQSNAPLEALFADECFVEKKMSAEIINTAIAKNIQIYTANEKLLKSLCETETPQGLVAVVKTDEKEFSADTTRDKSLFIILEKTQDPGNLGTIIRTAAAANADGIILSEGCVDAYNPKVIRSTMSAIFSIPIYANVDLKKAKFALKNSGFKIFATSLKASKYYFDANLTNKTAFIFGNESKGISAEVAALSDERLTIPILGNVDSLNLSQAVSIMLFETIRQRLKN